MRRASKKRIRAALADFATWSNSIEPVIARQCDGAARCLRDWVSDVHDSIVSGDLGACAFALRRAVDSHLFWLEAGFYRSVEYRGHGDATWHIASYSDRQEGAPQA